MNRLAQYGFASLMMAAFSLVGTAQQSGSQPPVKGMASTVGLYVYPQKNQSATQQLTDEQQCYNDAKSQTGYDPGAATTAQKSKEEEKGGGDHDMAKGAARGAVISRATGGDAAAGARRGAIVGGIRSKREQKKEQQAQAQANDKKTEQNQKLDDFKRATTACLDARGYSVR
jgi:hypothetical protein